MNTLGYFRCVDEQERGRIRNKKRSSETIIALHDRDANSAYEYVERMRKRNPKLEPIIAQYAHVALFYARKFIGRRWPEAEPAILQNRQMSIRYAAEIIRGRWIEAECIFAKDASYARQYASIIEERFLLGEDCIAKHPKEAATYAIHILKARWKQAERYIFTDPYAIFSYCTQLNIPLKHLPKKAQTTLLSEPDTAAQYALHIKQRLIKHESVIAKSHWIFPYLQYILKFERCRAYELQFNKIRFNNEDHVAKHMVHMDITIPAWYAQKTLNGNFPEFEKALITTNNPSLCVEYAKRINKRFKRGEQLIQSNREASVNYIKTVLKPLKLI